MYVFTTVSQVEIPLKIIFKAICKPITVISKTYCSKEGQKSDCANTLVFPQTTWDQTRTIPSTSFICVSQSELRAVGMHSHQVVCRCPFVLLPDSMWSCRAVEPQAGTGVRSRHTCLVLFLLQRSMRQSNLAKRINTVGPGVYEQKSWLKKDNWRIWNFIRNAYEKYILPVPCCTVWLCIVGCQCRGNCF